MAFVAAVAASFGACAGHRMGASGRRVPSREDLLRPSACDACGTRLRALALLPLLGFLLRCRACGAKAPWPWPALEWSAAASAGGCLLLGGLPAGAAACLGALALSLFAACDRAGAFAPSALSWPAALAGVFASPVAVVHGPLWAASGGAAMWGAALATRFLAKRRGVPFGGGDVALSAMAGSWGGLPAGPLCVAALGLLAAGFAPGDREVRLGLPLGFAALASLPLSLAVPL